MVKDDILSRFKNYICGYYPVSDEAFNLIADISELIEVEKNQVLLPMGEVSDHIYYIYRGTLIAYFTDADGNTYNKNIFMEHQLAASTVSSLLKVPSEFTLQALERTTLLKVNFQQYKQLISQNAELQEFYIAYLEKNWVIDKEQREISLVMEDAGIRYQNLIEQYPDIHLHVPLQHIASNLGITPTQLSRIRKKLKSI